MHKNNILLLVNVAVFISQYKCYLFRVCNYTIYKLVKPQFADLGTDIQRVVCSFPEQHEKPIGMLSPFSTHLLLELGRWFRG